MIYSFLGELWLLLHILCPQQLWEKYAYTMDRDVVWGRVLLCGPVCLEFLGWPWIHDLLVLISWKLDHSHAIPCLAWMLSFKLLFVKLGIVLYLYELNRRLLVPYDSYEENRFAFLFKFQLLLGFMISSDIKIFDSFLITSYLVSCILQILSLPQGWTSGLL